MHRSWAALAALSLCSASGFAAGPPAYNLIVRHGTIVDGSGGKPFVGDVAVRGDRIVAVAPRIKGSAGRTIDARGLTVAPGFIKMLSWANEDLIEDGASEGDIRQGVTLEVMGEGNSEGPCNDKMIADAEAQQSDRPASRPASSIRPIWGHMVAALASPVSAT